MSVMLRAAIEADAEAIGAFDYPAGTDEGPIPVPCHRYVKKL